MMSSQGANPIFFNRKKKNDSLSRTLAKPRPPPPLPPPPTSDNISFLSYSHTPSKGTLCVYHPLKGIAAWLLKFLVV